MEKLKSEKEFKFEKLSSKSRNKNESSLFEDSLAPTEELDPFDTVLRPTEPSSDYQDTRITPLSELFPRLSRGNDRVSQLKKLLIRIFIFGVISTVILLYFNSIVTRRGVWVKKKKVGIDQ